MTGEVIGDIVTEGVEIAFGRVRVDMMEFYRNTRRFQQSLYLIDQFEVGVGILLPRNYIDRVI